jgi:hypothetical protein
MDGLQRHPVKPRTRRRSAICRGCLDSNLHVLPAAAARISPSLTPPSGGRSHLPLPRASQRRPLAPPTTAAASSAYGPLACAVYAASPSSSPSPISLPPHHPGRRRTQSSTSPVNLDLPTRAVQGSIFLHLIATYICRVRFFDLDARVPVGELDVWNCQSCVKLSYLYLELRRCAFLVYRKLAVC